MSLENQSKLKKMLASLRGQAIATSHWLLELGISPQLVRRYIQSGWLESIGQGAFKILNDKIQWYLISKSA